MFFNFSSLANPKLLPCQPDHAHITFLAQDMTSVQTVLNILRFCRLPDRKLRKCVLQTEDDEDVAGLEDPVDVILCNLDKTTVKLVNLAEF